MTNQELYLSFLNESNTGISRQSEVTKRLAVGYTDLEKIATNLKSQGVDLSSLKKQIERAGKTLNLKVTLHKGKKNDPCKIGEPKKASGGTDKYATFEKWFDNQASEKDLKVRKDFVQRLIALNNDLEKAYKEMERLAS